MWNAWNLIFNDNAEMNVHCYENETVHIEWYMPKCAHAHKRERSNQNIHVCIVADDGNDEEDGTVWNLEQFDSSAPCVWASLRAGYVIKIPFPLCLDMTI